MIAFEIEQLRHVVRNQFARAVPIDHHTFPRVIVDSNIGWWWSGIHDPVDLGLPAGHTGPEHKAVVFCIPAGALDKTLPPTVCIGPDCHAFRENGHRFVKSSIPSFGVATLDSTSNHPTLVFPDAPSRSAAL